MIFTILTGRRPQVLKKTLESIYNHAPELFNAHTVVYNNAGDKATTDVIKQYDFTEVIIGDRTQAIGTAISLLAVKAYESGEKYWLSAEDDFLCTGNQIQEALDILKADQSVSQVRLRREDDGGLNYHMVTKQPLVWQQKNGYKIAEAHRTFNNNLTRTIDIPKCFPCSGERDCQKQWLEAGMEVVAQIQPGMFKHDDGGESLRLITRCEP